MPNSIVPKTMEFWNWKHALNPFGASPCLLALSGDQIVGVRIFMRWSLSIAETEVLCVRAVDTAIHPRFRGRKLFSKLTMELVEQMKQENVAFVFNTPNKFSLPGYLKLGWKEAGRIPLKVRPLRPLHSFIKLFGQPKNRNPHIDLNSIKRLVEEPELEDFLSTLEFWHGYHTKRTRSYLQWRYIDIPGIHYGAIWKLQKEGSAVLIYRERRRQKFHELSLSEILVTPNQYGLSLGRNLIQELARRTKADYMIATAAKNTAEAKVLDSSGFLPAPRMGPIFAVLPILPAALRNNPVRWKNWRCSLGDIELF